MYGILRDPTIHVVGTQNDALSANSMHRSTAETNSDKQYPSQKETIDMTKKPQIHKTSRILLKKGCIYCSTDIIREISPLISRMRGQIFAPLKGEYPQLIDELKKLSRHEKYQHHFSQSAITIIEATNV